MFFQKKFQEGQNGNNKGLPLGEGLANITSAINGIQKGRIFTIASPPKIGKSTYANYAFLLSPYEYCIQHNIPIHWIYFSLEINLTSMMFDLAAHYLYKDYGISKISLQNQIINNEIIPTQYVKGKDIIPLSSDYLLGRILDDNNNIVMVKDTVKAKLQEVYYNRIVPLLGEYDDYGNQIKQGAVTFIESKQNPTGIYKYLLRYAENNGKFIKQPSGIDENGNTKYRIISYIPNNPLEYTIIITDHCRLLIPERGYTLKQTVDKYFDYCVDLRNICNYTFVNIIHTNRDLASTQRITESKDILYPGPEDIKESGNPSESSDYVFTMFNPNDDRYRLKKHFGLQIRDVSGNPLYPNMRTIHLVESRHCEYPQHFRTNMFGNVKNFEPFQIRP